MACLFLCPNGKWLPSCCKMSGKYAWGHTFPSHLERGREKKARQMERARLKETEGRRKKRGAQALRSSFSRVGK